MSDRKEKYEKLKVQLEEGFDWPNIYLFKFIIPAENHKIAQLEKLFNTEESTVSIRQSSKGKYVSITAKEMMMGPDQIIERYLEAENIEGLISL